MTAKELKSHRNSSLIYVAIIPFVGIFIFFMESYKNGLITALEEATTPETLFVLFSLMFLYASVSLFLHIKMKIAEKREKHIH